MTAPSMTRPKRQAGGQAQAQPMPTRPYRVGVQPHYEVAYDETRTLGAGTVDMPPLSLPPAGWLRGIFYEVTITSAGNSAATAFNADGAPLVIDTIQFEDVNSQPIFGPFTGYEWYLVCKYGGYFFSNDPKLSPTWTAVTGSGATGGSASFVFRVPVELVQRDGLGPLANKSGTAQFKVRVRLSSLSTIYSVAPTVAPTVRVKATQDDFWDPEPTDLRNRPLAQVPPANGTTQFWTKNPYNVAAGTMKTPLERVGFPVRMMLIVNRDPSGSRTQGEIDWTDPFTLQYESNQLIAGLSKNLWRHKVAQDWGYDGGSAGGGTIDAGGTRDSGVFPWHWTGSDFGGVGFETRRAYLDTATATRLELQGVMQGSGIHTVTVITNDVSPGNGDSGSLAV